ncbi:MAG: PAS domain-containing protein [Phycisphaerales bacterium]|jgi:iron only hydrogenase large subunit-like protein|nr:PAS domain-containing protein [Phycisphaerales bacterium]MBT7170195.1 PAS domain-containing protein [Phycisphaerales bacterium]
MPTTLQHPVVFTDKANCRDCYRCLRQCPVKAIRMADSQARVDPERCIACGTCIRQCPQGAKQYRQDLPRVQQWAREGRPLAASLAPSFVAAFAPEHHKRLISALRKLGFGFVAETAVGAWSVAQQVATIAQAEPNRAHICTACPAAVNYVEHYYPDLSDQLMPLASPMAAHGRHLAEQLGEETKLVFLGPCVAKKDEANRASNPIDCALTFAELRSWLEQEDIDLNTLEESDFDEVPGENARLFPLSGGLAKTAQLETDLLSMNVVAASGVEELDHLFQSLRQRPRAVLVDPLFCSQGCANGPAMGCDSSLFDRRDAILTHSETRDARDPITIAPGTLRESYSAQPLAEETFSDEEIRATLRATGKAVPADELDCGACGYDSCRDKARAVLSGMAEADMCIPYMRRLAEQRTDRIIETSPNGIVILDRDLRILAMNPAFERMFSCSDAILSRRISYLMDPGRFERLAASETTLVEETVFHDRYNLLCRELCYTMGDEEQYVGVFVNITQPEASAEKLDELRKQTVLQAQQLMDHQIQLAQRIAAMLGESTAQGEELLNTLLQLSGPNESNDHGLPA